MTRRVLVAAVSGLVGLTLAGCGASQTAATASQLPSIPGLNATEAGIGVRNVHIPYSALGYPAGSAAPVQLTVFNDGPEQVQLTGAESQIAPQLTVVFADNVNPPHIPGQPDPAEQPAADELADVALAPGEFLHVTLLADELTAGVPGTGDLPVTLTFDNGAEFALSVPVAPPDEPLPREEPLDVGHH